MGVTEADAGWRRQAASEKLADNQRYDQPEVDAEEHPGQQSEASTVLLFGQSSRLLHRASISLLAVGTATAQLTWFGVIGYGLYWIAQQLS